MKKFLVLIIMVVGLPGCVPFYEDILGPRESPVQMRNYQSRSYDTGDKAMVLRAVISTMQDLDFIVNGADEKLGTVSGKSYANSSRLTVSVRVVDKNKTVVRASAEGNLYTIRDPIAYQNFFNALGKSLFLEAHEVD